jgi:membrane-bound serine protease (ClpP class)
MKSALLLPMLAFLTVLTAFIPQGAYAEKESYKGKIVVIPVGEEDLITRARFEFMSRTLERCSEEGAEAVIFDLDTPGGLLWDTVDLMMNDLQKLKPRSYAFVNKRALSAGAMIAIATDGIYMAPAGTAGAASPVYGGGQEMGEAERAKMNSATMGMARAVAKRKGHDPRVIEAMIDMSRELKVGDLVLDSKDTILTLDAEQAIMLLDGKPLFAKGIANTLEDIKKAENLTGEIITAEPAGFEIIALLVTKYAAVLILIGVAGGYLEMQTPGFGLPGFVSIAAFSLFFFGHYVAGSLVGQETVAAVIALFVVGVALLVVELIVFPGMLVPGILGFGLIMVALVYTMSGVPAIPGVPVPETEGSGFDLNLYVIGLRNFAIGVLGAGVLILVVFRFLPNTGPFQKLVLASSIDQGEAMPSQTAVLQVGDVGQACSALRPYGTVQFGERRLEAMVEGGYLQNGTPVRIREINGPKVIVEEVV